MIYSFCDLLSKAITPKAKEQTSLLACHTRSRGSTRRSKGEPLGSNLGATKDGNIMAARCAILLFLASARSLFWVLEQPKGSLFQMHPQVEACFKNIQVYRKRIEMGNYGAATKKPTWLYSGLEGMKITFGRNGLTASHVFDL